MKHINIQSENVLYISNLSNIEKLPQSWVKCQYQKIAQLDKQQKFDCIVINDTDEKIIIAEISNIIDLCHKNTELHITSFKKNNCVDFLIELSKHSLILTYIDINPLRLIVVQKTGVNLDSYRNNLSNILNFMLFEIINQSHIISKDRPRSLIKLTELYSVLYDKLLPLKSQNKKKKPIKSSQKISKSIYHLSPQKKQLHKEILDLTQNIKDSNGSRYYPKIKQKIGIISDNILYNAVADCADFIYITPDNYIEVANEIDVFMFIACWTGLNNEWQDIGWSQEVQQKAIKAINFFRILSIPTIFWSIEDPTHYGIYINIAQSCDIIYTTAEEKIPSYKKECSHDNVYAMSFGINPLLHNPINMNHYQFKDKILFAGAWYNHHPDRVTDMKMLFDEINKSSKSLYFIDRNFYITDHKSSFFVPKKYHSNIYPSVSHKELQKLQKLFPWCLNLSTVKDSFTMFANRVPELQAQGAAILSNYSIAINSMYPNIFTINNSNEINPIFNSLTDEELLRHRTLGIRNVMENDTYFQKLSEMLSKIGFQNSLPQYSVLVVVEKITNSLQEMFDNQILSERKILIELSDFTEEIKNSHDMIAFWGENRFYEEFYLQDLVHGFKYTNSSYITKHSFYKNNILVEGIVHDYVDIISDKYATLFWSNQFSFEELMAITDHDQVQNGYAIHQFEYQIEPKIVENVNKSYKLSVIVPCYNNGNHLWSKCFLSLKRSSMFNDMEILIIDDGSKDNYTPTIIKRIARQYPNVKTYFYPTGGSGSASRPRNYGIELASADYITYLDPDNEALFDGYTDLYKIISKTQIPVIMGYIDVYLHFFYSHKVFKLPKCKEYNGKDLLINKMRYKPQSMQAMIFSKQWLHKNPQLRLVEKAFGEDTLFFYQLAISSDKFLVVDIPVHIYHIAVKESSVNNINLNFFERSYLTEEKQIQFLLENNIIDSYISMFFFSFYIEWYLIKIKTVKPEDYVSSVQILHKIYNLYAPYIHEKNLSEDNLEKIKEIQKFFQNSQLEK